jgi:hypothetical protein
MLMSSTVWAGASADTLRSNLEAGTLAAGVTAITSDDAESAAARGTLKFLSAIEHLGQAFHRHGLEVSRQQVMGFPILRMPVPPNAKPERLDYAGFRAILAKLVDELAAAEADLAKVGDSPVALPIDLAKIRLDLDGDGKASDYESLGVMMSGMAGASAIPAGAPLTVDFDTADIYWLRGYSNFIAAFAQLLLSNDFNASFDKTFHLYFPKAGLPLADKLVFNPQLGDPMSNGNIADAISLVHLINWNVVEPERRKDVLAKLKAMADLSRKSWASARAETDGGKEWMPNARQQAALPLGQVDDVVIDSWLDVVSEFEQVLDGKKLLPHWRFNEGMNLKRYLEEGETFDLVLLIAGADAVPFLEQGPVSDQATWDRLMAGFRGNFLGYALWFN